MRIDDVVAALQPLAGHRVWTGEKHAWQNVTEVVRLQPKFRQKKGLTVLLGNGDIVGGKYPGGVGLLAAAVASITWAGDGCTLLLKSGKQIVLWTDGRNAKARTKIEPAPVVGTAADVAASMAENITAGKTTECEGLSCMLKVVDEG